MILFQREIKRVHLELSSYCNLACPQCRRTEEGNFIPDEHEHHLSLNTFKNIFAPNNLRTLSSVYACGTAGDPLMNPKALEILSYCRQSAPYLNLTIHTNGSYRNAEYFRSLAKLIGRYGYVVFAIDGLEDTNHIYRRNAKWSVLMKNVKAYIEAGGRARWQWIAFKHTAHQMEQARALALQLGFEEFFVINNTRKQLKKDEPFLEGMELPPTRLKSKVVCNVLEQKEIYLSASGHLSPCCFVGGLEYSKLHPSELFEISEKERNMLVFSPTHRVCKKHCSVDTEGQRTDPTFIAFEKPTVRPRTDVSNISTRKK